MCRSQLPLSGLNGVGSGHHHGGGPPTSFARSFSFTRPPNNPLVRSYSFTKVGLVRSYSFTKVGLGIPDPDFYDVI